MDGRAAHVFEVTQDVSSVSVVVAGVVSSWTWGLQVSDGVEALLAGRPSLRT